jgi:hypothetical protein
LTIGTGKARLRGNRVSIRLKCPASEPGGCFGTLVLRYKGKVAGARTFRIGGGRTAPVAVTLRQTPLRLLRARHQLPVTASAAVRDGAGNRKTVRRGILLTA